MDRQKRQRSDINYCKPRERHAWSDRPQQTCDVGQRLTTGEVLLHEWELEMYIEPAKEKE